MKRSHSELIKRLDRDGILDKGERFLEKHPESPNHLTYRELKEQIFYYL
ncbi:hypothetical protein [Sulfitobacter sp. R18_1]|nr:hypothetical protein [Sulfitobacter sp. R18_1]MBO9428117.1 hypothetical protein [Sulfitobacter sp. R18_1]